MHETNRMIAMVHQTKLMPKAYENALDQAVTLLDEIARNLREWPASRSRIRVPKNFTHLPLGAAFHHSHSELAANDPLLPLAYEMSRAHEALDTILNAFHFTHGGIYSLDYTPRMPEMAGHDSDPWVTAHTMPHPMDKSSFRAAFHAMLTTLELMKAPSLDSLARHTGHIAALYKSTLDHLAVRAQFYDREHNPAQEYSRIESQRAKIGAIA